ncbi:Dabb family protein (plasmid) [Streptomyces sp. HUAS TT3]|uniref:Dabb family protein n=1 Tax=unclassified Streptomyces TaxID=2593676 RepID=UPI00380BEC25
MIRHTVLFRFKPGIDWSDPRAGAAEAATAGHPDRIEEILGWEYGRNLTDRPVAYDFALIGTFADREAVDRYLIHPDHVRGVGLWREIATWVVADFAAAGIRSSTPPAKTS